MRREQIKNNLMNIVTGAVILSVLIVGYFVFKGKSVVTSVVPVAGNTTSGGKEALVIGADMVHTFRELRSLQSSVEVSIAVFELPAFKNLQDFSVSVPSEAIGKTNPFSFPDWKIKMKALEEALAKQQGNSFGL